MSTISPLTPQVGVEVVGVSGHDFAGSAAAKECGELLQRFGVVVYREVHIDDADLIALSRSLGEVAAGPTGEHEWPEIQTITLDPGKTNPCSRHTAGATFHWHIDGATEERPQKGTLLSRPRGGRLRRGRRTVRQHVRGVRRAAGRGQGGIADLQVVHSFAAAQALANPTRPRPERAILGPGADAGPSAGVVEPRRRRSLLLGATAGRVVGWPSEEGRALLERLLGWATRPEFVVHHDWRRGDLVTWDNTGMLHRAMPFAPTSPTAETPLHAGRRRSRRQKPIWGGSSPLAGVRRRRAGGAGTFGWLPLSAPHAPDPGTARRLPRPLRARP